MLQLFLMMEKLTIEQLGTMKIIDACKHIYNRLVLVEISSVTQLSAELQTSSSSAELYESTTVGEQYIVTVQDEIIRLLITPLGSRVMRPEYGSELYKLRDRELNQERKLMATKYTFVAINNHIERVRCRKVEFELLGDGKVKMQLQLEAK